MSLHNAICSGVVTYAQNRGHYAYRVTNNGYGRSGHPDVLLCIFGLYAVVEVKTGKDKLRPAQVREITDIQNAKGRTCVTFDMETAEKFILDVEAQARRLGLCS